MKSCKLLRNMDLNKIQAPEERKILQPRSLEEPSKYLSIVSKCFLILFLSKKINWRFSPSGAPSASA